MNRRIQKTIIASIISALSFSFALVGCGNTLPTIIKTRIVGETSGGGVCIVGSFATASGTVFRGSENRLTGFYDTELGDFICYEDGVPAEISFGYDCYYDLAKLYNAIHSN